MAKSSIDLPQLDLSALPGPETIHRRQLSNGITLLVRENFASPSVVLSGFLPVGSLVETEQTAGLAVIVTSREVGEFTCVPESVPVEVFVSVRANYLPW